MEHDPRRDATDGRLAGFDDDFDWNGEGAGEPQTA
jgi:hypothetical protein